MISFSKTVKEELLTNEKTVQDITKLKINLCAIIDSLATLSFGSEELVIDIKSTNTALIRETLRKLKLIIPNIDTQIIVQENKTFQKNKKNYIIRIRDDSILLLKNLELIDKDNFSNFIFNFNFPKYITKDDSTTKEYLKYLFICSGSINNPKVQKQYHLEIANSNKNILLNAQNMAEKYEIFFKITMRKNVYALYLNKGEEIADFLKLIGGINSLFKFEDYRLSRDIRATENRLINAEIANETKKQTTSLKQIDAINKLKKFDMFNDLKPKTKDVANLRLNNPNASLAELVELSDIPISKSNIKHHLSIILKAADF